MMGNWVQQYYILWKQYLTKYRLWLLLPLFASLAVGLVQRFGSPQQQEYRGLLAGVCVEDEKGKALLEKLEQEKGIFTFCGYTEEEEMVRQVKNGTLECGYMLPEGFFQGILEGKPGRQITLYYSPASSAQGISFEIVFADLFEMLSSQILEDYLKDNGWEEAKEGGAARARLLALNEEYQNNGSTFYFEYETVEGEIGGEPARLNTFRGLVALLIFFMSLLGLGNELELEQVWRAMPGSRGRRVRSGIIHVAVLGSVLSGGGCLLIGGAFEDPLKELAGLLLYFTVLEVYVRVLGLAIRKSNVLYGLFPALLLGSCLFAPVFIRLDTYVPFASWIARLFPAAYYLDFFLN